MRIRIINPNTSAEMTRAIGAAGRSVARPGTAITTVSPAYGPASVESCYGDYLSIPGLLEEIATGDTEGYDAYIIACYGDPGLRPA